MGALLKIVDEHFGAAPGERRDAVALELVSERVTAREIIRRRVADEVASVNRRSREHRAGHARTRSFLIDVDEDSAEAALNRPIAVRRPAKPFDENAEFERAIKGFEKARFILLLDDRQVENLDEDFTLQRESEMVFLYLTPLRGG